MSGGGVPDSGARPHQCRAPRRGRPGLEKGSAFYLSSPSFWLKMAVFAFVVLPEVLMTMAASNLLTGFTRQDPGAIVSAERGGLP